jgi:putative spermidine/putrescine transport system ATP-binding protein
LFVTHDQEEALAVSDRVAVMNAGHLEQLATPAELYSSPATPFVGEFVGLSNRIPATVEGGRVHLLGQSFEALPGSVSGSGVALVRPEVVGVEADDTGEATVATLSFRGPVTHVVCTLPGEVEITAQIPSGHAQRLAIGQRARITVEPIPVLVIAG